MRPWLLLAFLAGCSTAPESTPEPPAPLPVVAPAEPVDAASPVDAGSDALPEVEPFAAVLGAYETKFINYEARAKNIERALFAPVVLESGAEFSFNATVGPRTAEAGFVEAPVIFKGEMDKGLGGGVCQLSSTIHAAALFASLEINERMPHSRPSKYMPPGLDATVGFPEDCKGDPRNPDCYAPDLRFRNPYSFPIKVVATVNSTSKQPKVSTLRVEILGERVTLTGLIYSFHSVRREDFKQRIKKVPGKPTGFSKKAQKGLPGMLVTSYLKDAQLRITHTYQSSYPATDEVWEVAEDWPDDAPPPWEALDAGAPDGGADAGVAQR